MRRLLNESIRPYLGLLAVAVACMAVMATATAMTAWLMKPVVNDVFFAQKRDMLWLVGGAVFGTFAVKGLANFGQSALVSYVGYRVIADSQSRLYAHLLRMDISFFHANATGKLLSRFTNDINLMKVAVANALTALGKDLLSLIGLILVMFLQDPELASISFFIFPVAIYPIVRLGKRVRKVTANTQVEMGQFLTLLEQTFQGIRVVKAYNMEEYEKGRIAAIVDKIRGLSYKAARTRALSSPIMETLGGSAVAIVIIYGGYKVIEQQIDAGSFFSFVTALLLAYEPMKRLANLNSALQEGLAGTQRMFDVLDMPPKFSEKPGAVNLAAAEGRVSIRDVHFSYTAGKPVINGVTLEVSAGKTAALVGPSGVGKSTLLNLIPRFYDIDSGSVSIDGIDVRDITFASLYANIALVSQEITLFDDTIRANIAYGRAGASEEDIIAAAENAAAHGFISEMPKGYDTIVGEHGIKLSGGQRQRLAIARAMLKNAPILLLDEATSALDTESERQVQAALHRLMKGRTTLVIAHRLSTVVDADVIYVIENGKVVESGSHNELLAAGGAYAHLHDSQFIGNDSSPEQASAMDG
ncbi:MAG: ABC transporter permease [Rhodospirillales bacterium RIFCSPLOWO2_12_FULL_58_28]|nr:MAG: ABC transporter permease [Rhodospirillales bacterium RIFCSPLOWO2_12_FULL_58_28]